MNIFFYPIEDPAKSKTLNPYTNDLMDEMERQGFNIINRSKPSKIGILSIVQYFSKADVVYLNWVENVIDKRLGVIQNLFFYILIMVLKLTNKKIVWLMHNKISHSKDYLKWKLFNTYLLINHSDLILTHSNDGITFSKSFAKTDKNIHFKHHPIENNVIIKNENKKIDILIWGAIAPYKGIDNFLNHLKQHDLLEKYKIKIVGRISNKELQEKLESYSSEFIDIENSFVDDDYLDQLLLDSKVVLFTYSGYSTLSSGALMLSLSRGCNIIGPNIGAFKDLDEENIIHTFTNFDNLIEKLDSSLDNKIDEEKINKFKEENSWNKFVAFFKEKLLELK